MNERNIFLSAIDLPVGERQAYLEQACANQPELRSRVEALLVAHEKSGSFLNAPADPNRTLDTPDIDKPSDESDLTFLQPATKPGSMGRLGHYEILEVLGRGGFGIVFKAFDEKLHRVVAIKAMAPHLATTSPPRKRFLREARAVAAIGHENVVAVYAVEEQPIPYLVMEYVAGSTLQAKMDEAGPLSVPEVLHLGRQIAAGLAAAHALGLIHRDIKPGNVLLEKGVVQKVKITDFGLARTADDASLSQSGTIAGTPLYMAPEQAKGAKLDPRADLFSLGSVLYALACGHPPFRAATTLAVLRRVAEDTPRPLQEVIPETPDWFVAIIDKLLAKEPADRFQTAQEVADLLALCQSTLYAGVTPTAVALGLKPAPVEPAVQAEPKRKKFPVAAVAAGVVLMLAVMAAGVFFLNKNKHDGNVAVGPTKKPADPPVKIQSDGGLIESQSPIIAAKPIVAGLLKAGIGFQVIDTSLNRRWELTSIDELAAGDRVETLRINGTAVADPANIALLKRFPAEIWRNDVEYRVIYLNGPFSPERLSEILAIPTLQSVNSLAFDDGNMAMPDGAFADLVQFTALQAIYLKGPISDDLLKKAIAAMPRLQILGLGWTKVTSSGLAILRGRSLHLLGLTTSPQIDDTAADHLAAIPTLETLDLGATSITDAGLAKLTTLTKLKTLHVNGTKVTEVGVKKLAAALPQCQIVWAGGVIEPKMLLPLSFKNKLGMEFVKVPKGTGWLGGGAGKQGETKVVIEQDFYLGKYEVTQEEWEAVTGLNPSYFSRTEAGKDAVKDIPDADLKRFPVEAVSWDDCQLFIERLNKKEKDTGWVYRLPKEAEWEYACRGGPVDKLDSAFDFYFAKPTNTLLPTQANFAPAEGKGLQRTCKVGSYESNALGLSDMHGNVSEWCSDIQKATDGASHRVVRGNDWHTSWRYPAVPPSERHNFLGLRVARVPVGPAVAVPATTDPDRKAAEWVLSVGGSVRVDGRISQPINKANDLPEKAFRLTSVLLTGDTLNAELSLAHFKECKHLALLSLSYKKLTDEALENFKECTTLQVLNLRGIVSDAALAYFKNCKSIVMLDLNDTPISDAGLAHFKNCSNLENLALSGTQISDVSKPFLSGLTRLNHLRLTGTKLTPATIDTLKKALPNCKIQHDGGVIEPKVVVDPDRKAAEPKK